MKRNERRGRASRAPALAGDQPDLGRAGHRHARLEQILLEEIDSLLRDEIGDPRLRGASVLSVELSVDYRAARVRVAVPTATPIAPAEAALERAAPFLRRRLLDALDTRYAPALRFIVLVEGP